MPRSSRTRSQCFGYSGEIDSYNNILKVRDPEDFLFGIMMGFIFDRTAFFYSDDVMSIDDQILSLNIIYEHVPEIRERISRHMKDKMDD